MSLQGIGAASSSTSYFVPVRSWGLSQIESYFVGTCYQNYDVWGRSRFQLDVVLRNSRLHHCKEHMKTLGTVAAAGLNDAPRRRACWSLLAAAFVLCGRPVRRAVARRGPQREGSSAVSDELAKLQEQRQPPEEYSRTRRKLWMARQALQSIDDFFVDLLAEDNGSAIRLELQRVIQDLGRLPALLVEMIEEPGTNLEFEQVEPLVEELGKRLSLAVNWTLEADNCWNFSCGVARLDEARINIMSATDVLLRLEVVGTKKEF